MFKEHASLEQTPKSQEAENNLENLLEEELKLWLEGELKPVETVDMNGLIESFKEKGLKMGLSELVSLGSAIKRRLDIEMNSPMAVEIDDWLKAALLSLCKKNQIKYFEQSFKAADPSLMSLTSEVRLGSSEESVPSFEPIKSAKNGNGPKEKHRLSGKLRTYIEASYKDDNE